MRQPYAVLIAVAALTSAACSPSGAESAPVDLATKSTQGEVSFDLTPRTVPGEGIEVAVRVNTHSGDLADLDLRKAMVLEAGGQTFEPASATELTGHHAQSTVRFTLDEVPDRFAVTISGVRSLPPQRVEWP